MSILKVKGLQRWRYTVSRGGGPENTHNKKQSAALLSTYNVADMGLSTFHILPHLIFATPPEEKYPYYPQQSNASRD